MAKASGWPTASTQKSIIFPPVIARTVSTTSSREASITSVAPKRLAQGSRQPTRSMPMTWLAPIRPRSCVKIRPIGPWPTTAQRWLMTGPVRAIARSTVASGWATTIAARSGSVGRQPGQPRRLRADVLDEAVVVVGMGQARACPPASRRPATRRSCRCSRAPANRAAGEWPDWPNARRASTGPCSSRTGPHSRIAPALRHPAAEASARRRSRRIFRGPMNSIARMK